MHAAVRRYVVASAALLSASVIAVTPVEQQRADIPVASPAVSLAADSIANVPVNLLEAIASAPANEVKALHALADSLVASGNWLVLTPTNVFGWDTANPEMLKQLVNALVPFPAISEPLGDQLNIIAEAELPMYAGCTLECADVVPLLKGFFQVPLTELISGYTFPTVVNPVGGYEEKWSRETVHLEPLAPIRSLLNGLVAPPAGIATVTLGDVITVVPALINAAITSFNPFVPESFVLEHFPLLGLDESFPGLIKGLIREFCPSCAASSPTPNAPSTGPAGDVEQKDNAVAQNAVTEHQVQSATAARDSRAGAVLEAHAVPTAGTGGVAQQKDGEVQQNSVAEYQVQSVDAAGGVATDSQSAATAAEGTDAGAQTAAPTPDASQKPCTSSTSVEKPTATSTASADTTNDGNTTEANKVDPGQAGGKRAIAHERPAGAVSSLPDRVSSAISKVTEGREAAEKTGSASTGGHDSGNAGK